MHSKEALSLLTIASDSQLETHNFILYATVNNDFSETMQHSAAKCISACTIKMGFPAMQRADPIFLIRNLNSSCNKALLFTTNAYNNKLCTH
jgi:hypothetical protein